MQLFKCKVRLGGNVMHEVIKDEVTAPEVIVLRHIHGYDGVLDLQRTKSDKRPHEGERERLSVVYGDAVVAQMFGPGHNRLPLDLDDVPRQGRKSKQADEVEPESDAEEEGNLGADEIAA